MSNFTRIFNRHAFDRKKKWNEIIACKTRVLCDTTYFCSSYVLFLGDDWFGEYYLQYKLAVIGVRYLAYRNWLRAWPIAPCRIKL
jgi:hypothetical protein